MLRPLLLATTILCLQSPPAYSGVVAIGGTTSEVVDHLPEVKVDTNTYNRIMDRLRDADRIEATFRGETMQLVNIRVDGREHVVESQLRLKITRQ